MDKVAILPGEDGCWMWTAACTFSGYGCFSVKGVTNQAHRVSYEIFVGVIPEGLHLDHKCHTKENCPVGSYCMHRRCVNPKHLEPCTPKENKIRGHSVFRPAVDAAMAALAARTHCEKGHEINEENTRPLHKGSIRRYCILCRRMAPSCDPAYRRNKTTQRNLLKQ